MNISKGNLGKAHLVDTGDEEREFLDYWSRSASNWHYLLVLHGKKELSESMQKSMDLTWVMRTMDPQTWILSPILLHS